MKQAASIPPKKILPTDRQWLINLKLRYNSLADKINSANASETEREQLLAQLTTFKMQIEARLYY